MLRELHLARRGTLPGLVPEHSKATFRGLEFRV